MESRGAAGPADRPRTDQELFAWLYPQLRRFAAVLADLDMDPDDLVQDALAQTLRRHDLSEIDNPLAYLKRAMVNSVSNTRRRSGRFRSLLPQLAAPDVTVDDYPSDLALLDELAAMDRAVLFLVDIEGLSFDIVAAELGISAAATRKRASRARKQLRNLVGPDLRPVPASTHTAPTDKEAR